LFGDTYGWTVDEVLNLTIPEVELLQDAMLARLKKINAANEDAAKNSKSNFKRGGPKKRIENVMGKMKRLGVVSEE